MRRGRTHAHANQTAHRNADYVSVLKHVSPIKTSHITPRHIQMFLQWDHISALPVLPGSADASPRPHEGLRLQDQCETNRPYRTYPHRSRTRVHGFVFFLLLLLRPAAPSETLAVNSPDAGTLIPGLPDDVAALILASLPYPHQLRLRSTCRSWRSLLSPASLLPLRRRLRLPRRHLLCLFPSDPSLTPPLLFDPAAPAWSPLPPLPCSPHIYGLSNFVPVALGHHLYLLGGSHFDTRSYPLGHPSASAAAYRLDLAAPPLAWSRLPDMLVPRGSFASAPFPIPRTLNREAEGIIVAGAGRGTPCIPPRGAG
uniref:F-box domain-containing protein n=1 Tax=Ananas comosus var. bracteatus TaxID=296719 RepID=A0A6V7QTC6_ANACO